MLMQISASATESDSPLRSVRLAHGQSLRDLAEATAIDVGTLSRLERGLRPLRVNQLFLIAQALGIRDLANRLAPFVRER